MSYVTFNGVLKKVNLKPKGVKEIVLEVTNGSLAGKLDRLSDMVDNGVLVSLESQVVAFGVKLDARTDKPLTTYKVDERGVVSEVKQESEQMELELGLPKEEPPTKEKIEVIDAEIVDAFIMSGLAPTYEDMAYNFQDIIERLRNGESYLKIAGELNLNSAKFVDILSEYRKRVAPLAKAWDEWRQGQDKEDDHRNDDPKPAAKDNDTENDTEWNENAADEDIDEDKHGAA